jgi:hypothetical protein
MAEDATGFPWKDIPADAKFDCFTVEEYNFGEFKTGYKQYLMKSKKIGACDDKLTVTS